MAIDEQVGEEADPAHGHDEDYVVVDALFALGVEELRHTEVRDDVDSYKVDEGAEHVEEGPDVTSEFALRYEVKYEFEEDGENE